MGFVWKWLVPPIKKKDRQRVKVSRPPRCCVKTGDPRNWIVVWNINFIFPYIVNLIIPIDELIFFRGGKPTTNQQKLDLELGGLLVLNHF